MQCCVEYGKYRALLCPNSADPLQYTNLYSLGACSWCSMVFNGGIWWGGRALPQGKPCWLVPPLTRLTPISGLRPDSGGVQVSLPYCTPYFILNNSVGGLTLYTVFSFYRSTCCTTPQNPPRVMSKLGGCQQCGNRCPLSPLLRCTMGVP